ncbi:ABC transporter ATP-binding protein [Sediminitomix flava]|uniref:ABC-2 type transport system ATP-binding protein n=1 Tax=Sediminitomix flava TaxID=379075 RepID=A0A315Z9G0_SEDFL|nr:ABC transporter ATP-binding protein [Sediminitomix flava]PWJ40834.1 ABC-2 type transport system ATP-binding protein [Sediminitomix flava]
MIEINKLSFGYKRNKKLYDQLDLKLVSGNIYGLLGQNGAGKSTLFKIIMGLKFPKEGSCKVFGYESKERNPEVLQDIFLLAEEFYLPDLSITDYEKALAPFYPNYNPKQFRDCLTEFKVDWAGHLKELSYGQKKKVLIAFALATNCKIVLMDEPTNGLDIPSKSQFRKIIASNASEERIFIISTHQVRDLESLIDPIIIVDQGRVVFNQSCEQITDKLVFTRQQEMSVNNPLYYETAIGNDYVIGLNEEGVNSNINLELLFNGVTSEPQKFEEVFETLS